MEYWDSVQDTPVGQFADKVYVQVSVPVFLTVTVYSAVCPGSTSCEVGVIVIEGGQLYVLYSHPLASHTYTLDMSPFTGLSLFW